MDRLFDKEVCGRSGCNKCPSDLVAWPQDSADGEAPTSMGWTKVAPEVVGRWKRGSEKKFSFNPLHTIHSKILFYHTSYTFRSYDYMLWYAMFIFKHSTYINGAPPFLTTWSSPQFSWHILSNSRLAVAGLGGATGWQVHFSAWKAATEWRADADIRKNALVFERIILLHPLKEKDLFKNLMAREQGTSLFHMFVSLRLELSSAKIHYD